MWDSNGVARHAVYEANRERSNKSSRSQLNGKRWRTLDILRCLGAHPVSSGSRVRDGAASEGFSLDVAGPGLGATVSLAAEGDCCSGYAGPRPGWSPGGPSGGTRRGCVEWACKAPFSTTWTEQPHRACCLKQRIPKVRLSKSRTAWIRNSVVGGMWERMTTGRNSSLLARRSHTSFPRGLLSTAG
jgi:hypothetical protein